MTSTPWRRLCFTDSLERAWEARRLPRTFTSRAATATSSSLIQLVRASAPGTRLSPERLSFTWSTPYLRNMRTAFRIPSGPSTTQPKDISGNGRCGSMSSPSEPVTVISWLAAV